MEGQIKVLSLGQGPGIAASYARTNGTSSTNLDNQEARNVARAEELGYPVPESYRLRETASGSDPDRPALAELYRLVASHEVQCVVAYDVARLSRSRPELLEFFRHAQEHGVLVEFVATPLGPEHPLRNV